MWLFKREALRGQAKQDWAGWNMSLVSNMYLVSNIYLVSDMYLVSNDQEI